MRQITTVGIYLAKNVFALHGVSASGEARVRRCPDARSDQGGDDLPQGVTHVPRLICYLCPRPLIWWDTCYGHGGVCSATATGIACREALQQASIRWRLIEAIVPTIHVSHRRCRKLLRIGVVKRRNRHEVKDPSHGLELALPEGADAARLAEVVVQEGMGPTWRRPLIVRLLFRPRDEAKVVSLHEYKPRACLGAN